MGRYMLGQKDRDQPELFVAGSLRGLLPDDQACITAKVATGEVLHVDASLIRADVSEQQSGQGVFIPPPSAA
jgi:hypothetical protein